MNTKSVRLLAGVVIAVLGTGCGDLVRQGRGPSQVVLNLMQAASGAEPETFGGTLSSDVITNVERQIGGQTVLVPTVFSDIGQVCQWQPKTAHLWQPKTAHSWGGRLGRSGHSPGDARRACWAGRRERSDRSPAQHAPRSCGAGGHVATPSRCSSDAVLSQC